MKKPTRRKLTVSPPTRPDSASGSAPPTGPLVLQEVLKQEGMFPLQYTPEPAQNTPLSLRLLRPSCSNDPNMTFDIDPGCEDATPASGAERATATVPSASNPLQPSRADDGNRPAKRLEIPSLLEMRRNKPLYMAMTSAAQGKRKFNCSIREDGVQGPAAPKRVKQEPVSVASRPLRVRRFAGSEENEPRRVVRSTSEGNLNLLEARKHKSLFYKTSQQFKKVTKRM